MSYPSFIIIDDSELDRFIVNKLINHIGKPESVKIFINAKLALDDINKSLDHLPGGQVIVFLDVQMPVMNGFEFIEAFDKLPEAAKSKYYIIALSSSMNKLEMKKMRALKPVKEVIEKPITLEKLIPVLDKAKPDFITNRLS
jgi:CheY-like chemotaxis protein